MTAKLNWMTDDSDYVMDGVSKNVVGKDKSIDKMKSKGTWRKLLLSDYNDDSDELLVHHSMVKNTDLIDKLSANEEIKVQGSSSTWLSRLTKR